ncbi:MAG: RdgB/HAM1 family non-canonical purine NTP pyrophosphatase [Actinomycetota bacterium]
MRKVLLGTNNLGKLREIRAILSPIEVSPPPTNWIAPEETGTTYLENAQIKAESLSMLTGEPALADDSGIEVDALNGGPGVRSARFAGEHATDEENLEKLIAAIKDREARTARYRCVAVLFLPDAELSWFEGTIEGTLITEKRGSNGFGYDPIFVPIGENRTMAELSPAEKDAISHRGKAFRGLIRALSNLA